MDKFPARTGWQWIKEGFVLFRKQPVEISALFISYMFLMLLVGIIPLLGQVLPLVLIPAFSMAFLHACADIERGERIHPRLLFAGFRSPAMPTLIKLGLLYALAAVLAVAASSLIDGGVLWRILSGAAPISEEIIQGSNLRMAMLFAALVYAPAAMAFWYAAPLAAWQRMGLGKALFYSFFSVLRNSRAFVVYVLGWFLLGVIVPAMLSALVVMLTGAAGIVMLMLLPLTVLLTVVMYCSFYPTYTQVFGKPEAALLLPPR